MTTLKISDLSVGDWVRVINQFNAQIYGYHESGSLSLKTRQGNLVHYRLEDIHPIPITAEMLKKNGFEEDNNGYYALKIGGIVAVDIEYTGGIWELSILDVYALQYAGKMQVTIAFVSSIHNLQHAIRLAGLDKEIYL